MLRAPSSRSACARTTAGRSTRDLSGSGTRCLRSSISLIGYPRIPRSLGERSSHGLSRGRDCSTTLRGQALVTQPAGPRGRSLGGETHPRRPEAGRPRNKAAHGPLGRRLGVARSARHGRRAPRVPVDPATRNAAARRRGVRRLGIGTSGLFGTRSSSRSRSYCCSRSRTCSPSSSSAGISGSSWAPRRDVATRLFANRLAIASSIPGAIDTASLQRTLTESLRRVFTEGWHSCFRRSPTNS